MDHFYSVFNRILKHIGFLLDFVIHIDKHLARLFHQYGLRVYAIIFGVIFIETGFAPKLQVSEESTFEEDLEKGNHVRLRINTQKLNVFSEDGSRNLIKGVSHGA